MSLTSHACFLFGGKRVLWLTLSRLNAFFLHALGAIYLWWKFGIYCVFIASIAIVIRYLHYAIWNTSHKHCKLVRPDCFDATALWCLSCNWHKSLQNDDYWPLVANHNPKIKQKERKYLLLMASSHVIPMFYHLPFEAWLFDSLVDDFVASTNTDDRGSGRRLPVANMPTVTLNNWRTLWNRWLAPIGSRTLRAIGIAIDHHSLRIRPRRLPNSRALLPDRNPVTIQTNVHLILLFSWWEAFVWTHRIHIVFGAMMPVGWFWFASRRVDLLYGWPWRRHWAAIINGRLLSQRVVVARI